MGAPDVLIREIRIPLAPRRLRETDAVLGDVRGALSFIPDVRRVESAFVLNAKQRRSVKTDNSTSEFPMVPKRGIEPRTY